MTAGVMRLPWLKSRSRRCPLRPLRSGTIEAMERIVGVSCTRCETLLFVATTPVDPAGAFASDSDFTGHLATSDAQTRKRRLAVADANGRYRCPICDARGQLA
jgi:hypothetical protein